MASPRGKNKGVKKLEKTFGKNKKAISTILAALLMVVIVVVASVMVYAWSTGLLGGLLVTPTVGKEALNVESTAWNANNMNVSLSVRNTGTVATTFTTYYISDASGNTWTNAAYSYGPTIQPNAVMTLNLGIYTQCGGCTAPAGSAFQSFVAGNSYTVKVVTSRSNPFVFTVVR
jgi:hypothetical protein